MRNRRNEEREWTNKKVFYVKRKTEIKRILGTYQSGGLDIKPPWKTIYFTDPWEGAERIPPPPLFAPLRK